MIVVVGTPAWREAEPAGPDGRACRIAVAAARHGRGVELVGRAGEDRAGDALMLALARAGVGHVALLRDPTRATPIVVPQPEEMALLDDAAETDPPASVPAGPVLEPADVSLGLRYLPSYDVIVVTDDAMPGVIPVAAEAAAFAGAQLVVLVAEGAVADGATPEATVLEAPGSDPDGAFAELVAGYAAALDNGTDPRGAFEAVRGAWTPPVA